MRHSEHEIKVFECELYIRRFLAEIKAHEKRLEQFPEEPLTWWDNFNLTKRYWRQWNRTYGGEVLAKAKSRLEYWTSRLDLLEPAA